MKREIIVDGARGRVASRILERALQGDTRAAKLFLEITAGGHIPPEYFPDWSDDDLIHKVRQHEIHRLKTAGPTPK